MVPEVTPSSALNGVLGGWVLAGRRSGQRNTHLLGKLGRLLVKRLAVVAVLVRLGGQLALGRAELAHNRRDERVVRVGRVEEVLDSQEDCMR